MSHLERSSKLLLLAIKEATKGYEAASGSLIRKRAESSLSTALAICKEDAVDIYKLIDEART